MSLINGTRGINKETCQSLQDKVLEYAVLLISDVPEFKPFRKQLNKYASLMERLFYKCDECNDYNVEKTYCPLQSSGMATYINSLETYFRFTGMMRIMERLKDKYTR